VVLAPLPWAIRLVVWLALGLSLAYALTLHALRTAPRAVVALELDADGNLALQTQADPNWQSYTLRSSFVHPWVTLLRVRPDGRRSGTQTLLIAADAAEPEAFRRLRARLAFGPRGEQVSQGKR